MTSDGRPSRGQDGGPGYGNSGGAGAYVVEDFATSGYKWQVYGGAGGSGDVASGHGDQTETYGYIVYPPLPRTTGIRTGSSGVNTPVSGSGYVGGQGGVGWASGGAGGTGTSRGGGGGGGGVGAIVDAFSDGSFPSKVNTPAFIKRFSNGSGQSAPNTEDPDYPGNRVGYGGDTGAAGGPGAVVVKYYGPGPSPTFGTISDQNVRQGDSFNLTTGANNVSTLPMYVSATGLPPGLSVDPQTGVVSGIPTTAGKYPCTLTAANPYGPTTISFTWYVADTAAPTVPQGLVATKVSATGFTLSWPASTDNVGVIGYEVQCNGASLGTDANTSRILSVPMDGTAYVIAVRSRDAAGNWSAWSSPLNCRKYNISVQNGSPATFSSYPGEQVTVTSAVADTGKYFFAWNVAGAGFFARPKDRAAVFTVCAGDAVLTPTYADGYKLNGDANTIEDAAGGSAGSVISIHAPTVAGKSFAGWTILNGPGYVTSERAVDSTVVLGSGDMQLMAVYYGTNEQSPPQSSVGAPVAVDPTQGFTVTTTGTMWNATFTWLILDYSTDNGLTWNSGTTANGRMWRGTSSWVSYPIVSQTVFYCPIPGGSIPTGTVLWRTVCGDNSGHVSCPAYSTTFIRTSDHLDPSYTPTGVTVSNITTNYFKVSWNPPQTTSGVAYYDLQWNGGDWGSVQYPQTYVLGGEQDPSKLTGVQTIRVRSRNGNQVTSAWSAPASFSFASQLGFAEQPQNVQVGLGGSATFSVAASGYPGPFYQWYKNGVLISGATASTYTIASALPADVGSYTVTITDGQNTLTSNPATLTIVGAPTITSALSASATTGTPFSYTITASDNPSSFAASHLPPGLSIDGTTGIISGAPSTAGIFNVGLSATNAAGTSPASLVLTIAFGPSDLTTTQYQYDKVNQLLHDGAGQYTPDEESNIKATSP